MRFLSFSAVIRKTGVNPYVDAPGASEFFGKRGFIPVKGSLQGRSLLANLVPLGKGRHRLYLNGIARAKAGVGTGDRVRVRLAFDPQPRIEPIPRALALILKKEPKTRKAWESLSPSRRKEVSRYLNGLKTPEAFQRTLRKVLGFLREPRKKPRAQAHVIVRSMAR